VKASIVVAAVTLLLAAGAGAVNPTEGVALKAVAESGVAGKATAGARGAGTRVVFSIRGLAPGAKARAIMQAGTCKRSSASFAPVGSAAANASGTAQWSANVRFHGEPVGWATIADGAHVFQILAGGRVVACGVIPGMS
jgi:hypothetical protein